MRRIRADPSVIRGFERNSSTLCHLIKYLPLKSTNVSPLSLIAEELCGKLLLLCTCNVSEHNTSVKFRRFCRVGTWRKLIITYYAAFISSIKCVFEKQRKGIHRCNVPTGNRGAGRCETMPLYSAGWFAGNSNKTKQPTSLGGTARVCGSGNWYPQLCKSV